MSSRFAGWKGYDGMSVSEKFLVTARSEKSQMDYYATIDGDFGLFGSYLDESPSFSRLRCFDTMNEAEIFISEYNTRSHDFFYIGIVPAPIKVQAKFGDVIASANRPRCFGR